MVCSNLVVLGRNSYIGNYFYHHAKRSCSSTTSRSHSSWKILAASSRECNLLCESSTANFFSALPNAPTVIVCFSVINKSAGNSYETFTQNMQMVTNLVHGSSLANVTGLIYIGSVDVFGVAPELPITEKTQMAPDTWYGLAKYSCEWVVRTQMPPEVAVSVVRVPGVFGSAPNDRSIIGKFVRELRASGSVALSGTGDEQRDYVWVSDVSRLLLKIAELQPRTVVNAVTGVSYSLAEIARRVGRVLDLPVEVVASGKRTERDFDLTFDNSHLRQILPDFEFSSIEDGIRSYLAISQ